LKEVSDYSLDQGISWNETRMLGYLPLEL
jgi:hypothetical protein